MSTYTLFYTKKAQRYLASLPKEDSLRIRSKLRDICEDPKRYTQPLVNMEGERKLRVGEYRIILSINDEKIIVTIIKIGHRRNIYK